MAKHTPLVCQYLEKISRAALEKHQRIIREYVAKRHGVYALYRGNRLYYVGLASPSRPGLREMGQSVLQGKLIFRPRAQRRQSATDLATAGPFGTTSARLAIGFV